jgi:3-oxoacyl-(acyl-carrier-protein) synthase
MTVVVVTGIGVVSPLGTDPNTVAAAISTGTDGLTESTVLQHLPDSRAGVVEKVPIRPWLKRRKDRKLMARASELALAAAGPALGSFPEDRVDLGLFLGVGREPPDDGESEASLAASSSDGRLDPELLATRGRDRYPPLLPLKTLPNMALAHISINLGIMGENGAWAGREGAGQRAVVAGIQAISEGRVDAALVGGADSLVDLGSARDRLRLGHSGPPGEAAAVLLLESIESARRRKVEPLAVLSVGEEGELVAPPTHLTGDVGAAAVPLTLVGLIAGGLSKTARVHRPEPGDVSGAISVAPPTTC